MFSQSLLLWICFAYALIVALPAPSSHVLHEKRELLHPRWTKRGRIQAHDLLPMRIGLAQSNLQTGHESLMEISDPNSPSYGKHWTSDQVIEAFRPTKDTEHTVRDWLIDNGISLNRITHSDNKAWFAFYATADEAERLMHTDFHEYEDSLSGVVVPACDSYHLPRHVSPHVDYITPGIRLLAPKDSSKKENMPLKRANPTLASRITHVLPEEGEPIWTMPDPNDLSNCSEMATPACIAALYDIPPGKSARPDNTMGIFESLLDFYIQEDLDSFFSSFTPYIPNGTKPIAANVDGGQQSTDDLLANVGETNLDLMVAYPILWPQMVTDYDVDDLFYQGDEQVNLNDTGFFNTFLDAIDGSYCTFAAFGENVNSTGDPVYPDPSSGGYGGDLMCGVYTPTNVISISYGGDEVAAPVAYQRRQCLEFMKLGLQGISILLASGDFGVGGAPDGFAGCLGENLTIFSPNFPSCPYVTLVGGTQINPGDIADDPETALYHPRLKNKTQILASGGGFSNIYPIPDYQASAVAKYFSDYDPPYAYYSALEPENSNTTLFPDPAALAGDSGGIYNRIGRGYPDVSALASNVTVFLGGELTVLFGTSAATPIFGAIITRINEERLCAGKSTLGFLNPSLYGNPSMLNDITNGTNPGCGTPGFSAAPGWDPVTGLGTPNYPKMLEYFMSLP